ncbi:cellulase family glycosylhydrolase [Parvularcula dongshanensis]|uniref:mannan endo-1,4-beta-mannosidase n=1 Tax=Parvularcula dongshanensis TaxID=1173995 RepID=A0A840I2T3_9PROT|nr:cellulase family glycosylhydrolase [Parvularcula dongshanensis]MBB4658583.1 hypothetical protein [Parvularcula dongshanensis]
MKRTMFLAVLAALPSLGFAQDAKPAFEHFITREGAKLYDGDEVFRFVSWNVPTLNYVEDEMAFSEVNPYALPNEFELRDLFESVNQMGGQVVRGYTIPVRNEDFPEDAVTYVEAPGEFNEEAFRVMDLGIALAGEYGVRVIQPLVNNWPWMGGRPNYAAFRGKDTDAFCTDPEIREDFKQTIRFVLNRTNTVNGVKYKDDPTIMAWETGNEMTCPAEWAVDIARTIKSEAPNQLVLDGYHAVGNKGQDPVYVQQHSIDEDAIDLISTHHYEENPREVIANIAENVRRIGGKKPLLVGEFGFMSTTAMEQVIDFAMSEDTIPGALIWSLRRHHRDGGWYYHTEPLGGGLYRAYHWPGFGEGEVYDERALVHMTRQKAFAIQGKDVPSRKAPAAPTLLPIEQAGAISWQGSAGASAYTVERRHGGDGDWTAVATGVDDMQTPGFPLLSDIGVRVGEPYYYRVTALNEGGESAPSNVVGPVVSEFLTLVDDAENLGTATFWENVSVVTGDYRSYKEAYDRLMGEEGASLTYTAPGRLRELRIYAFEKSEEPHLSLTVRSQAGKERRAKMRHTDYASSESNYDYAVPRLYSFMPTRRQDVQDMILDFSGRSDIVRVEIDYVPEE